MLAVKADLSRDRKTVIVKSPFSPTAAETAKQIPGYKWVPDAMAWAYPFSLDTLRLLRETYGPLLVGTKRLNLEARRLMRSQKAAAGLKNRSDVDLPVLEGLFPHIPKAMDARPYQKIGTAFVANVRNVGIFDEVGLGKTITSIAGTIEAGKWEGIHLVTATKTALESVWGIELRRWTNGAAETHVIEGTYQQRKAQIEAFAVSDHPSKWLIVNPAMLAIRKEKWCTKCKVWMEDITAEQKETHLIEAHKEIGKVHTHKYPELQSVEWDSIIIDEAHKDLSTGIKSSSNLTQVARGLMQLRSKPDGLRIALTGTPMRGKELNLWGIMHWLRPAEFRSKWDWVDSYFEKTETFFGSEVGDIREEREPDFWAMLDASTLRRTKAECRPGLAQSDPPRIYWVKPEGKHLKQYRTFEQIGELKLPGGTMRPMAYISERMRLRQLAWGAWTFPASGKLQPTPQSPKLAALWDLLEERGIGPKSLDERPNPKHFKYAIASQFTEILDLLQTELEAAGIKTMKITGDTPVKRRAEYARSFQEDPNGPRIILLNTYAAGESLTLDRYCDTMFILDKTDIWDDQAQLHGRIDNRSVTEEESVPRDFVYILTEGTIDMQIEEKALAQHRLQHRTLDARRGVKLKTTNLGDSK